MICSLSLRVTVADISGCAQVGWGDPGRDFQHADTAGGTGGSATQSQAAFHHSAGHTVSGE